MEKVFKTKTGFCHVTEDQIILTRDGIIGNVAKITVGNSLSRILIFYGLISIGLFYFAYHNYVKGDIFAALLFGLLGLYLTYGIVTSWNNSAAPIIDRKDIQAVKLIKGMLGITRSRFEITFTTGEKVKKRLILLTSEQDETKKAVEIMNDEKLLY